MAGLLPHLLSAGRQLVAATTAASLVLTTWPATAQNVDGAAEARTLAPTLLPDPEQLFQLEDGTVILQNGGEIPLERLFPSGGDATALEDAYGDEGATVDLGHATQQELNNADTADGEAYRTLLESPYDGPRDLAAEPWFDNTRTILGDIERLGAEFGGCVPVQTIGTNPRTVWLPDPRICTRPAEAATSGACRIEHTLSVIESNAFARIGAYGKEINTFVLNFSTGTWTTIAPSDGTHFAGEVPVLDKEALCASNRTSSFALSNIGTWKDAPVPGGLDDTITVTTVEAPSCANNLTATVRLGDPGGETKFKSGAELALSIIQVTSAWWPEACLDLASGAALPATCTITATAIDPPDQDGCAVQDGRRICAGDPFWQTIPPPRFDSAEASVSRLAAGADIQWSCPAGTLATPVDDTCEPLRERPECRFQSSSCVAGMEDADDSCTVFEDSYDCGREVVIDDGGVRTELQCEGDIACIGDACVGGENETNPNFAEVAATLKGAELAALDGACDPVTGRCAVFTGRPASCKRVLAGTVDCCQDVQGVSIANYLALAFAVSSLDGAMATLDPTHPLRGGWEVIGSPVTASWDWIGGQFTSALNGITGATTPAANGEAAMGILGAAQQQLMQQTAQWTLETFGPAATNALFTVNGGAAVAADGTLVAGTVQIGGVAAAVGTALTWVAAAYTAYQAAILLAQIIWACEDEELELAVKRELKQCKSLGSYCATDSIAGCIESRRSYCCYASPISRILQEQIRPQLGLGFGNAEDPDCSGISFTALAEVDWSKVNLNEWVALLADNGQLPDAASITLERLTGNLRAIDAAAAAGGEPDRPEIAERTIARTDQTDVPGALSSARDQLMPYLQPGGGAPKPRPEYARLDEIPPDLLQPWRLPNRWQEQIPLIPGWPIPNGPGSRPPIPELCRPATACQTRVTSDAELTRALSEMDCGCVIHLARGSYGTLTYSRNCRATNPLMLAAEDGTQVNGNIIISGNGGLFHGIILRGGRLAITGNDNRVTRFSLEAGAHVDVTGGASGNRLDHNDFLFPAAAGHPFVFRNATGTGNRVDSNYWTTHGGGGSGIGFYLGQFSAREGYEKLVANGDFYTVVERNLWEDFGKTSIIEVKSNRNVIRNNTIVRSSRILQRHGANNLYDRNYFQDVTKGLMLREHRNIATGNYFHGSGTALRLMAGERSMSPPQYRSWLPAPFDRQPVPQGAPAAETLVVNNQGLLIVGDVQDESNYLMPTLQSTISCHNGPIRYDHEQRTSPAAAQDVPICGPASAPTKLTRHDVGRSAPADGC